MYQIQVNAFGDADQLVLMEQPDPTPVQPTDVVMRLTSIGMNHADLMARRGEYKLSSGEPPFIPGIEGGGVIEAVGSGVRHRAVGQRVSLTLDGPVVHGRGQGTYRSHLVMPEEKTVVVPEGIPDELLGTLWLPYLTAWGCLIWRQNLQPGQTVLLPAASSSVAIAAAQIVRHYGGIPIGTTTRAAKADHLMAMAAAPYEHVVVTQTPNWYRKVKQLTSGRGVDIIFDPVAAGDFLNQEIRLLAQGGTLWIYGLLGQPDVVDVTPLIRKGASIRGWLLNELAATGPEQAAYDHVLEQFANGTYQMPVAQAFPLKEAQAAHRFMERGDHIGKCVLIP